MPASQISQIHRRQTPQVSISIVNFNGGVLLVDAIQAVLASTIPIEVFLVDNGSCDDSIAGVRQFCGQDARLRIIENGRNLGFTRANNMALKQATGQFVLLLNPDCIVQADTLERMLKAVEHWPDVGMAGCLLRNFDGSEQAGCRRAVPTPWRSFVRVSHLNKIFPRHPRFQNFLLNHEPVPQEPILVEAISGALMLVRCTAMEQVGLLDEGYFMHCDDLDWCMRFRQSGWKILFVPQVEVVHYKGICSSSRPLFVLWHKHKGMIRFYRKFFRHQYPLPLMGVVVTTVWLRFVVLAALSQMRRYGRPMGFLLFRKKLSRQVSSVKVSEERDVGMPDMPRALHSALIDRVAKTEVPKRLESAKGNSST